MAVLSLDSLIALLSSYEGRDKILRTLYYVLMIAGSKASKSLAPKLLDVAKQISAARTVGRRFGDIIMIKANLTHFRNGPGSDFVNFFLNGAVGVLYQIYYPVEHVAWLSQFQLVKADSAKWWNYTTMLWAAALVFSMIKCVRSYVKLFAERKKLVKAEDRTNLKKVSEMQIDEITTFLMYYADFMNAINYLPKGFLWSQTFTPTKVGIYGFVASMIGLIKLFRRLQL